MKRVSKRTAVLLAVVAAAIVAAVGAYAYFTNAGTGSGNATVGTSSTIALSNVTVGTLYPGGADVPVTVDISNPGSGAQYVGTISGTVADNAGCLGSWFVVDNVVKNTTVAAGGTDTASTNVRMLDSGGNQDVCKTKTMTITWTSN